MKNPLCCTIVPLTSFRLGVKSMFSASIRFVLRTWQTKKDGTCDIMLQVIINRKNLKISTGLNWPVEFFDKDQGLCKPRWKGDTTAADQNIELRQALTKANEILFHYRTSGKQLDLPTFKREFMNYYNRANFLEFMQTIRQRQLRLGVITKGTAENHRQTLLLLSRYKPNLIMADITKNFPKEFDAWMRKQGYDNINTRFKHHRVMRTYINHAINEGFPNITKAYQGFTFKEAPSKLHSLNEQELKILTEYYSQCRDGIERIVLRRFLWSCLTGMRISDVRQMTAGWVFGNRLIFIPQKTRNDAKQVNNPLPPTAIELLQEEIEHSGPDKPFHFPTPQAGNRVLRDIGSRLGIKTSITNHVGRKTCATMIVKHFRDLHAAKEYLNHSSIKTTMKYDHVDEERKLAASQVLERIINED